MLPRRRKSVRTKPEPDRVISPGHLQWVRTHFCCAVTDKLPPFEACIGSVQTHHVKTRGAGGGDDSVVPLCAAHHAKFHSMGRETFERVYGVSLIRMAADLWQADSYHRARYEQKQREMARG